MVRRSLAGYHFPDPNDPRRYQDLPAFTEKHAHRFRLVSHSFTLFERAWMLRSMPELMVDMLESPGWIGELFDAITAFNLGVIEKILKYDIDGILFGDDWGQQQGLLFSPRLWRRLIKPRLAITFDRVKQAGKIVLLHSCGKVQELFPDLIEIGLGDPITGSLGSAAFDRPGRSWERIYHRPISPHARRYSG